MCVPWTAVWVSDTPSQARVRLVARRQPDRVQTCTNLGMIYHFNGSGRYSGGSTSFNRKAIIAGLHSENAFQCGEEASKGGGK